MKKLKNHICIFFDNIFAVFAIIFAVLFYVIFILVLTIYDFMHKILPLKSKKTEPIIWNTQCSWSDDPGYLAAPNKNDYK